MLRNIFTSALLVAILVVLVAGNMQAQVTNYTATVSAQANVTTALTIANVHNIDFGNIAANASVTLDPKGVSNSGVNPAAQWGEILITGATATDVLMSWPSTVVLGDGTPADNMTVTLAVSGSDGTLTRGNSTSLSTNSGQTVHTATADGKYHVYVGGSLATATSQPSGPYTTAATPATFTVEYK
jgi:hypothetical protein